MKHIKTYESWRQVKGYFRIPLMILEKILSKLVNYVPFLTLKYEELAAKIDLGRSISSYQMDDIEEISLDDIKDDTLRRSLKATDIFSNWRVYYSQAKTQTGETKIYITKDQLEKGERYYSQRLNIDEKDTNQIYIIAAAKSSEHDEMRDERTERYNKKAVKELEQAVDNAIKTNSYRRTTGFSDHWNNDPILFKVVRSDRTDLFNKIISHLSKEKAKELASMRIDPDGWETDSNGKDLLSSSRSDEMTDLIMNVLYTPEEIEDMKVKKNAEKYNL